MFNKIHSSIIATIVLFTPIVSFAQTGLANDGSGGKVGVLMSDILGLIESLAIPFLLGIGFLFFAWGMIKYFVIGGTNDEERDKGKNLMIYATLGFVLILIFWGVIGLATNFTGLSGQGPTKVDNFNLPSGG